MTKNELVKALKSKGLSTSKSSDAAKGALAFRSSNRLPWLYGILAAMAQSRVCVASFGKPPAELVPTNSAGAMYLGYNSLPDLVSGCNAAVQGDSDKVFVASLLGANTAYTTIGSVATATVGTLVFGYRVRIAAPPLTFTSQPVRVQYGYPTLTAGVVSMTAANTILDLQVVPLAMRTDVILMATRNAQGWGTIAPASINNASADNAVSGYRGLVVTVPTSSTYNITIESLNARDMIARGVGNNAFGPQAQHDWLRDGSEWEGGYEGGDHDTVFAGLRDEA